MNRTLYNFTLVLAPILMTITLMPQPAVAQSTLNCKLCHSGAAPLDQWTQWTTSRHANTQRDVAVELAASWKGQPPDSVIFGSQPENCVACHSPAAVSVLGGMTEVQVMGHFFSTTNGLYTDSTQAVDTANWPHDGCVTCHNVPPTHPAAQPTLTIFNSTTAQYDSVQNASTLCGYCHGTLRFTDTDHRLFDAWRLSKHGRGNQRDIASELAANWGGFSPDSVANSENCIACHAPTSVKMNGGISESQVLARFFTTTGGKFSDSTTITDTLHWPEVSCNTCHNPHKSQELSYFNSTSRTYQVLSNSDSLCGQCHGNLRFPDTDHLTYNLEQGTGGIGVADLQTMPGAHCVDCHMHKGAVDGTNALMYSGHRWSVFITEPDSGVSSSCTACHSTMDANAAEGVIQLMLAEYASFDSLAQARVTAADTVLQNHPDTVKQRYLDEAHYNLAYAESDESHGFHNHKYLLELLNDAIAKADLVTGVKATNSTLPQQFELVQNYPNPFNPTTIIHFTLPKEEQVKLAIYDILGRELVTLVNQKMIAGNYSATWDGKNENGAAVSSGIYLYRIEAGPFVKTHKMILIR